MKLIRENPRLVDKDNIIDRVDNSSKTSAAKFWIDF